MELAADNREIAAARPVAANLIGSIEPRS